jgi:transposase
MTVRALRSTAQQVQILAAEAIALEAEITRLVRAVAPWLLELPGMGPISAAQVLVDWSHAGPTALGGGLCRPGRGQPDPGILWADHSASAEPRWDRRLNRAPHTVAVARLRDDPATYAYAARRRAEGKSPCEIRRRLKRAIARQLFKLLQLYDRPQVEVVRVA